MALPFPHPPAARFFAGYCVLLALMATAAVAHAQVDRQASEFFRAGEAAYARGDFSAAARSFEEAHKRAPHAATLYNAGLAWEWASEGARAADDYDAALAMATLDPRQSADATMRLQALEKKLGKLLITAPDGCRASVAHVERAPVPVEVHVAPGLYDVTLLRPTGRRETTSVAAVVGERREVKFDVDLSPPPLLPDPLELERSNRLDRDRHKALGWVAVGTAGAMGSLAIYLGVEALRARDTFNMSGHTDRGAYDRATTLRTWTNVMWIGAGVAAATGVTLFLTTPKRAATLGFWKPPAARVTLAYGEVACAVIF